MLSFFSLQETHGRISLSRLSRHGNAQSCFEFLPTDPSIIVSIKEFQKGLDFE
jgi:hypothetical protein